MERLNYNLYKITNSENDNVYIGSTRRTIAIRMQQHRRAYRDGIEWKVYNHMREIGAEKFQIEHIRTITVSSSKLAHLQEQIEIWQIPIEKRLNTIRAHIPNKHYRTNIEAKRQNRRDFYDRKKLDPEWMEKERIRNKERMKIKRQLA